MSDRFMDVTVANTCECNCCPGNTRAQDEASRLSFAQDAFISQRTSPIAEPGRPEAFLDAGAAWLAYGDTRTAVWNFTHAIAAADLIDQQQVSRDRMILRQQLAHEFDPSARRALAMIDADLCALQRAPGVARANLGLVMLRLGYMDGGRQLLNQAALLDPYMLSDPYFQRHFLQSMQRSQPPMPWSNPTPAFSRDTGRPEAWGRPPETGGRNPDARWRAGWNDVAPAFPQNGSNRGQNADERWRPNSLSDVDPANPWARDPHSGRNLFEARRPQEQQARPYYNYGDGLPE